ncbi:hypothetical protein GCM10019017_00010 [Streptomyces showdoensis]
MRAGKGLHLPLSAYVWAGAVRFAELVGLPGEGAGELLAGRVGRYWLLKKDPIMPPASAMASSTPTAVKRSCGARSPARAAA